MNPERCIVDSNVIPYRAFCDRKNYFPAASLLQLRDAIRKFTYDTENFINIALKQTYRQYYSFNKKISPTLTPKSLRRDIVKTKTRIRTKIETGIIMKVKMLKTVEKATGVVPVIFMNTV